MPDKATPEQVATRLTALLQPLREEYRTGCTNYAAIGTFHSLFTRFVRELQAVAPDDDLLAPHLARMVALMADYADVDADQRARRLREIKRRLDALLADLPAVSAAPTHELPELSVAERRRAAAYQRKPTWAHQNQPLERHELPSPGLKPAKTTAPQADDGALSRPAASHDAPPMLANRTAQPVDAPRSEQGELWTDPDRPQPVRLEPVRVEPRHRAGDANAAGSDHPTRRIQLTDEVKFLKGVGPRRAEMLVKLGVNTVEDLLFHFPRRHEDRSVLYPLRDAHPDLLATFRGRIVSLLTRRPRGNLLLTTATVSDDTGMLELVWFNQPWVAQNLADGMDIVFSGRVTVTRNGHYQIGHPAYEPLDSEVDSLNLGRLVPIYPLTEGLLQTHLRRWIRTALDQALDQLPEVIPDALRESLHLIGRREAVAGFHFPTNEADREAARRRLVFEEFFGLQVALAQRRWSYDHRGEGVAFKTDSPLAERLEQGLPFAFTAAQRRVVADIKGDMALARPMNRLVQGDVGSGKTLVALTAALIAVDNGYQCAFMAPTEVLAEQHQRVLTRLCEPLGVHVDLFSGRATPRERRDSAERLVAGLTHIAVGTHALIQQGVEFHKLGLVIIDEQHRFGVLQRQGLTGKGTTPDVLVMTATPIPRTLALTVYGDLDTSVIDELPAGRQPITTEWRPLSERAKVYARIRARLKEGRQVYAVCPLVDESEKMELESATELAQQLTAAFPKYRVGLLHGRLPSAEKDAVMERFRAGEIDILAATTVIEVGIDVPNATVMLIVNAERFGLSQLHQLRGRVGRGDAQSECYLLTDARYNPAFADDENEPQYRDGRQRMRILCENSDGFKLAEADLELRGPGELGGTRQSGVMDLHVANLARDRSLLELARSTAQTIVGEDPNLDAAGNAELRHFVQLRYAERGQLAEIG